MRASMSLSTNPASPPICSLLAYVEQVLVPAIRPGDVVVLDNLAVHKQPAVPRGTAGSHANVTLLGRQTVCAVKVQE